MPYAQCLLLMLLICSLQATGAEILVLDQKIDRFTFGTTLEYLEDRQGLYTFRAVSSDTTPAAWKKYGRGFPNFGFSGSTYWFRALVHNPHTQAATWKIKINYPLIDHLTYHEILNEDIVATYVTGDTLPFKTRPANNRNFVFDLQLKPEESKWLYFRVANTDAQQFPVTLWRSDVYQVNETSETLLLGIAIGFLAVMIIYNLFLFLGTRLISHLYYVCFVANILFFQTIQKGFAYQYFWPNFPEFNQRVLVCSIYLVVLSSAVFAFNVLNLREYGRTLNRVYTLAFVWCATVVASVSLLLTPNHYLISLAANYALLASASLIGLGIYLWWKGNVSAKYLTIAWIGLAVGNVVFILSRLGAISTNIYVDNAMVFGSVFEVVMASFALADKYNRAQRQAYEQEHLLRVAKERQIHIQEEANEQLESQVKQRTSALERAAARLEEANLRLTELSERDALTGLHNRHFLLEKLPQIRQTAIEKKETFSLLLMDVDHFKSINDRFGHHIGDVCLKKVAEKLQENVYRSSDTCVRYGGEEFLVVLPNTNGEQAYDVAERIRKSINEISVPVDSATVLLSVSVGIYTGIPNDTETMERCIHYADEALYEAKKLGRNRSLRARESA